MGTIFFKVMEMSIAALLLMVAVALIRIPLKRAPKWFMGILWAIVALRLLVPVQVTAHVGFMPDFGNIVKACFDQEKEAEEGPITVNSGIYEAVGITKSVVNESADAEPMQGVDAADVKTTDAKVADAKTVDAKAADAKTKDSSKGILLLVQIIWIVGMTLVLGYAVFCYISIKKKTAASIRFISDDRVFVCDDIDTPFIFGTLKPTIYMPSGLDDKTIKNVIAHEKAHIKRLDHIRKMFGFLILAIHWFNPLVWLSYMLFCRDIELACDERVVSRMTLSQKRSYAESLLSCSTHRRMVLAYPLAFGEVGVGTRVKQIFNYKKPSAWLVAALIVICGILSTSSFTKAAEKAPVTRIPLVELKDAEVSVTPNGNEVKASVASNDNSEKVSADLKGDDGKASVASKNNGEKVSGASNGDGVKVSVGASSDETVRGIKYPIEAHEYQTTSNNQGVVNLPYQEGTNRAAVTIPGSNVDSVYVEVGDAQNVTTGVSGSDNVQVEVNEKTVSVSVTDGHENVTVKSGNPVVKDSVGEVLNEVNKIASQDEVLNQVVDQAVNEVVDEVYDEIVYDAYDEVVDEVVGEVFDEVIDIGLGGIFGLSP